MLYSNKMTILTYQDVLGLGGTENYLDVGVELYALVDHAGLPGLVQLLKAKRCRWVSLFEGTRDESALAVAPLLIMIDSEALAFRTKPLLNWIIEHGRYASSVSFLRSPLPMQELARRLSLRLDVMLPGDMELILRFFDGRVLESLLLSLAPVQKAAFLNVAHHWWYLNRAGEVVSVPAHFAEVDSIEVPLVLNAPQEEQMLTACEPDQIAASLLSCVPNEYQALPPQRRHKYILENVSRGRTLKLSNVYDLSLYCSLALLYGSVFFEHPAWQVALSDVKNGKLTLTEAAMAMEQSMQFEER